MRTLLLAAFALPVAACSCDGCGDEASGDERAGAPAAGGETEREPSSGAASGDGESAGGIAWTAPEPFRAQPPTSEMRVAEYVFPEEEGEQAA